MTPEFCAELSKHEAVMSNLGDLEESATAWAQLIPHAASPQLRQHIEDLVQRFETLASGTENATTPTYVSTGALAQAAQEACGIHVPTIAVIDNR
ncbi:MAG: hypothetical protein ACR2H3_15200 [Acidimicrobiales bacterium]